MLSLTAILQHVSCCGECVLQSLSSFVSILPPNVGSSISKHVPGQKHVELIITQKLLLLSTTHLSPLWLQVLVLVVVHVLLLLLSNPLWIVLLLNKHVLHLIMLVLVGLHLILVHIMPLHVLLHLHLLLLLLLGLEHSLESVRWVIAWGVRHRVFADGLVFDYGWNDALGSHTLHDVISGRNLRHRFFLINENDFRKQRVRWS